jgi:hypothetical protein
LSCGGDHSIAVTGASEPTDWVAFDPANAIKFTIYRTRPNGSPGDWDILGCQQYGPLLDIEIP